MAAEKSENEEAGTAEDVKVVEPGADERTEAAQAGGEDASAEAQAVGQDAGDGEPDAAQTSSQVPGPDRTEVAAADLPELQQTPGAGAAGGNIDMVLDVSVPIVVELGRTRMLIRDILSLGVGGVVELEKAAGEPVEVYVRDMKFASGEVVVVGGDRFGVRIKEIHDPHAE